ncbi:MAG: NAD(P)H-dependent oxidoreductase [Pseudomonadota bacterium]|nr:NAD(P)H-dependent oxidoreductase [Pseudomonadota bacterium]
MTPSIEAPTASTSAASIRHLLVIANPAPDSFDHAIVATYAAEAARSGQDTVVRDLYAMGFDPILKADERPLHGARVHAPDVDHELELVGAADIIVLVYPIWFGLPPAMLKGYVDRVLGAGYSFRDVHDRTGQPALQGKPLLSFSTSGTSQPWLDEQGQVMSLRQIWDVYLWQGFGMKQSEHIMIDSVVPNISATYAAEQLERVRSTAERTCAMLASNRHAVRSAKVMRR